MNRDEILAKSRNENKGKDLYENDVLVTAGNAGAIAAMVLATLFFVIQIFAGEGTNYGLYAIVFCVPAVGYIVKALRMHRRKDIVPALIFSAGVLVFSIEHIYELIVSSTIL